jgi:hypothetical protein
MGGVDGVVLVQIGWDGDQVVGALGELIDVGGEGHLFEVGELWRDEVEAGLGDVEADGGEDAAETLEELLADVADANDADDDVLVALDLDAWDFGVLIWSF